MRLDELVPLCEERNIAMVEDASESLGTVYKFGKYKGKHTGTLGQLGCLSFNGNKIITTGGGGMILTDDETLAEKAKYLTTQAKNDSIRYVHDEIGYNFRLTNIQAALGVAQLEQLPEILKRKKEIYNIYQSNLEDIEGLSISKVPDFADNNHWMNLLQIDSQVYGEDRETLMKRL
ncbi:MAG: DegT/DnrJ/EryC1/StrS family aminotransferase, partial [Dehalococcoidia bacterium]|nr:DegT/DnrJ/EryC1/StrS family aminotransferase [Dehalococcoidia bacterium]